MKKVLSVLLVAVLLITCMGTAVFAAAAPKVTVVNKTAAPGKNVTVNVNISNNPGFASFDMVVNYDKAVLQLTKVTAGKLCNGGAFVPNVNNGKIAFASATDVTTKSGTLFTLTFKVLAKNETTTKISIDKAASKLTQADQDKLTFTTASGTVTVDKCAAGHTWGEWVVTKEATCTEEGERTRKCTVKGCGKTETEVIPMTEHTYGDWTQSKAPTCTEPGEETRTCVCGHVETREIPATGHSHGDWEYDADGHFKKCACGDKIEAGAHVDADGDGKCDTCGYTMPVEPAPAPVEDDAGIPWWVWLIIAIVVLGIAGFCVWFFVFKKKGDKAA